ncbi:DUF746 domain-containing protein [Burkholderia pyrrocinia]|nr:DUF746 domain-containing protein [Burkholderia pyrrocinia]
MPRCPYCDGLRIRGERPQGKSRLPNYFCHACKRSFNRLTGTPFARLHNYAKGEAMIPLLSRQMSMLQAGERLGRTQKAILSWLLAFRRYLLELDPSGQWEARVRLGVRVAPRARCARCGFEGGFLSGGFDPQRRRRIRCPQCGRSRLLDVLQGNGEAFDGEVMHDAIETAVRARRKVHPDTPSPTVARAARVDDAAPAVTVRRSLAEVVLPSRESPPGPTDRREDPVLSAFLLEQIDAALSLDTTPPPCQWCGSDHTEHHAQARPNGLPCFRCRTCLAYFSRVSNTPLLKGHARAFARRLVPMLGWRDTAKAASHALGLPSFAVQKWLRPWRQWLLLLDPSGAMEARVRLGVPTAGAVLTCGKCGHTGTVLRLASTGRPPAADGARQVKFQCRQCERHSRVWVPAA